MAQEKKNDPQSVPRIRVERRRKPNPLARVVTALGIVGWVSIAAIMLMLDKASPGTEDFFTRFFGAPVRSSWNSNLLRWAVIVLFAVLIICVVSLILNVMRSRRKSDRLNPSIITLGIVSLIGIIILIVRFGSYM